MKTSPLKRRLMTAAAVATFALASAPALAQNADDEPDRLSRGELTALLLAVGSAYFPGLMLWLSPSR